MDVATRLSEYLPDPNTVKGGIAEVVEIIQKQAPLVVGEIIRWEITYNLIMSIICVVVIFVLTHLTKKYFYPWGVQEADNSEGLSVGVGIVLPIAAILIATGICLSCLIDFIKPIVAPKLFLFEYLSKLI